MSADRQSHKILIAFDGSPAARTATLAAIQIAQSQHWTIEGLYVVDTLILMGHKAGEPAELGRMLPLASSEELLYQFEARGDAARQWLEEQCRASGVTVTTHMIMGGIPEIVEEHTAGTSMIALGRRGFVHAQDPSHLGDNFRLIAHQTKEALLVGGDERAALGQLLLTYDGSERARHALDWTVRLQKAFSSEVDIVFAHDHREQTPARLKDAQTSLKQSGLNHYRLLPCTGEPASTIMAAATESRPGLILMGGYHHGAFLEWLVGSTVDQVLRGTQLPVLVA